MNVRFNQNFNLKQPSFINSLLFKPSPLNSCHLSTLTLTKPEPSQALYTTQRSETELCIAFLGPLCGGSSCVMISNEWYLQGSFFIDSGWFWSLGILRKKGFVCLYSVGKVFVVSSEWGFLIRRKNKIGPKNIFKLYFFFSLLVEAVDYGWLRVKGDEEVQLMK